MSLKSLFPTIRRTQKEGGTQQDRREPSECKRVTGRVGTPKSPSKRLREGKLSEGKKEALFF